MKKKIFKISITLLLISTFILTDFLSVGYGIVNAVYEELENQKTVTNEKNVEFNAYFLSDGNKTHHKENNLDEKDTLVLNINVKNKGVLNDAKIKIENANFAIEKVENKYIKDINTETKEIELNQIIYQNDVQIEIPIKFEKQLIFGEDYFDREETISISGKYTNDSEKDISGEVKIRTSWKQETDINLEQDINKYIELTDKKVLLEQDIQTQVQDDKLPRKNETLEITVPNLSDNKPSNISVLVNGNKIAEDKKNYDVDKNILTITNETKGIWSSNVNKYKIIYEYDETDFTAQNITLNTKVNTEMYVQGAIEKTDTKEITLEAKGNLVSASKFATDSIYKGYMYANSSNSTTYNEINKLEISNNTEIDNIKILENQENFVDEKENNFDISNKTVYTQTIFNKQNISELFGENGTITIYDENKTVLATVNNTLPTDENGNIVINYETPAKGIEIETTAPTSVGTLIIKNTKAIEGNTGYTKQQLKGFNKLSTKTIVEANTKQEIAETTINLLDTKTEATISINNAELSTLQKNENVQLLATLKSNNEQYDLYKNATVELVFPKEMKVTVKNITQLNGQNELNIANAKQYITNEGNQAISFELTGEQSTFINNINSGIQISITADINISKITPTKTSEITMNYTNENRAGESFNTNTTVKMNSKYGVLLINNLTGFNTQNDVIENTDDKVKTAVIEDHAEAKQAQGIFALLNNYENEISKICIVGNFSDSENSREIFEMNLVQELQLQGKNVVISYSENANEDKDSSNWKTDIDITKAKSYKIDFGEETIKQGEAVGFEYKLGIPENIEKGKSNTNSIKVFYQYAGDETQTSSTICLKTGDVTTQNGIAENTSVNVIANENTEKLSIELAGRTGGETLKNGQEVYEGQGIKYILKLKNNSSEEIKNIKMIATQSNAIFYDKKVYTDGWDSISGDENVSYTRIEENSNLTEKQEIIETLKPGESVEISYKFSVKEVEDNNQTTTGNIKITGDGIEKKEIETLTNPIKQGKLKLQMRSKFEEEYDILTNREYPFFVDIKNISNSTQQNVIVNIPVPDGFDFKTDSLFMPDESEYQFVEYKNRNVKLKIPTIEAGKTISIRLGFQVNPMDTSIKSKSYHFIYNASLGDEIYTSNEMDRVIYNAESDITAKQYGSIDGEKVKNGDKLTYTCEIENKGTKAKQLDITDDVPIGADIQSATAKLYTNGELTKEENIDITEKSQTITYNLYLEQGQKLVFEINTVINTDEIFTKEITNEIKINGLLQEVSCNSVTYQVVGKENVNSDPEMTYNISGVAWIDENKNGLRESTEKLLSGIEVILVDEETGKIATNFENKEITAKTGESGEYEFTNVKQGKYIVVFKYDTKNYRVTEYQKQGINEKENSDVVSNNITLNGQEQQVAMTKTLELATSNLSNIDAGFVQGEKFDLRLDKYISKIIIQNKTGTTVKQYDNTQLAKIELDGKKIAGTTVIVEYKLQVTNEGEVGGYVNEVFDNKPSDLDFSSAMNNNWYQSTKGELYTKELSNQMINPGETKTLTLTLTKTMNLDNTGTSINTAELNKVSNNYSLQDIDSTPGNRQTGEDDMSTAQLIISVKTGSPVMYISLIIIIIGIISVGVYLIKKEVLIDE